MALPPQYSTLAEYMADLVTLELDLNPIGKNGALITLIVDIAIIGLFIWLGWRIVCKISNRGTGR